MDMDKQDEQKLNDLARKLALNLIYVSIDEKDYSDAIDKAIRKVRSQEPVESTNCQPERFVVVTGAGASFDANSSIKLAKDAAVELKQNLTKDYGKIGDLIDSELIRLKSVYKLNPDEFETQLFALSRFYGKDRILKELYKIYRHIHYPGLCHEILAHMFKHRFIDAIINFNFDETLDRAIEDELCQGDYYKVISDGDAPNDINDIMIDNKFKKPLYIKPHGTASHKSTMRFTREDYFILPVDIRELLKSLLSGTRGDKPICVNLIVIGFKMQSIEFNEILGALPKGSKIFFLKPTPPNFNTEELKPLEEYYKEGGFFSTEENNSSELETKTGHFSKLDEIMLKLWEEVRSNFKPAYRPRTIIRHKLIAKLFSSKNDQKNDGEIQAYLKDRTYIELALSIAKTKGFLNMHQLTRDRTGIYYNLYKKEETKNQKEKRVLDLIGFCKKLGLHEVGYSKETFKLEREPDGPKTHNLIVDKKTFKEKHIDGIYIKLTSDNDLLSLSTKEQLKENEKIFKETLIEMYTEDEVEICPKYENIYSNIFSDPKVLSTTLALKYHSKKLLIDQDWDAMLNVAETGEWLLKADKNKIGNRKIEIIIADSAYEENLKKKYRKNLFDGFIIEEESLRNFGKITNCDESTLTKLKELSEPTEQNLRKAIEEIIGNGRHTDILKFNPKYDIYVLPWWLHNQHITIFLKRQDEKNTALLNSIYFSRRLRASNINPILLGEQDSRTIHESFIAYKLKVKKGNFQYVTKSEVLKEQKCFLKKICGNSAD